MPTPDAMPTPEIPTEELAAFDPPVAEAVAAVLLQAGLPTMLDEAPGGERRVLVPPARRTEALATLASRMEEVQTLAGTDLRAPRPGATPTGPLELGAASSTAAPAAPDGDAHGGSRPLVLERFRSFGWVAVALVPLLIIALANVRLPASAVVALVVGAVVLLSAWRTGRFGGQQ